MRSDKERKAREEKRAGENEIQRGGSETEGESAGGVEAVQRSKLGGERKRGWKRKSEPERMRAVSGETKQK